MAELRGQIALAENEVSRLKEQIGSFRVVPAYEDLKNRADDINRLVRAIPHEDITERCDPEDLQKTESEAADPDTSHLKRTYQELGVTLRRQVRQRCDAELVHGTGNLPSREVIGSHTTRRRAELRAAARLTEALGDPLPRRRR